MLTELPWLAIGSLISGLVSIGFVRYLWPHRTQLGGRFFIATICCVALWSLSYGLALFVFDPTLRFLFEIPIWLGINFIGVFFLAFALEYTGRGTVLESPLMKGLVLLQVIHTVIVATNPLHHIAWQNYHIEPLYGSATVAYTHQPWLLLNAIGIILMIAAAAFLLVDTVLSYGPLYRTQAAAIALSPIFPGLPFLLWLIQVGNSPPLNLTPLVFPIHLAFDMYAFFSRDMFEMVPAARRVADRAAIDNLGSAVIILDTGARIIELNTTAATLLGTTQETALGQPLSEHLEGVDPTSPAQTISMTADGRRRVYAVTVAPLLDAHESTVGHSLVLQDITTERQREQRLAVLNRVLRHNLRNDLNIVEGYVEIASERVDDPDIRELLTTATAKTNDLMDMGEKARDIERTIAANSSPPSTIPVLEHLKDIRTDLENAYPDATVQIDVPPTSTVLADQKRLDQIFRNLMENALEHNPADDPTVTITMLEDSGPETVTFELRDNGPGIPAHELDVLAEGTETSLVHGSGLGLWLVTWAVDSLGGTITFETDADGTTVFLELPAPDSPEERTKSA